jgi:hypothetical protein
MSNATEMMLALYFIPAFVGFGRAHQHKASIAVLNLFLGWTFVGWVVALVWAVMPVRPASNA